MVRLPALCVLVWSENVFCDYFFLYSISKEGKTKQKLYITSLYTFIIIQQDLIFTKSSLWMKFCSIKYLSSLSCVCVSLVYFSKLLTVIAPEKSVVYWLFPIGVAKNLQWNSSFALGSYLLPILFEHFFFILESFTHR